MGNIRRIVDAIVQSEAKSRSVEQERFEAIKREHFEPTFKRVLEAEQDFLNVLPVARETVEAVKALRLGDAHGRAAELIRDRLRDLNGCVSFGPGMFANLKVWYHDLTHEFVEANGLDRVKRYFEREATACLSLPRQVRALIPQIEAAVLRYAKEGGGAVGFSAVEVEDQEILEEHERRLEDGTPRSEEPWYVD